MPNTSTTTVSPDLIQAAIILPILEKYVTVLLYSFGFIGALLNIFNFLQKRLRIESCSTYFLAASITDFCYINSFILMQLISLFNLKIFSSINSTDIWCKFGNYFYFLLPCLASTYLTLASIDRFCASSSNNKLQKLNQLNISYILTLLVFLIWSGFALHIPISYDLIRSQTTNSTQCTPPLNMASFFVITDGYFFALYNGIIAPLFLIIFGLLILRNVKVIHRRIVSQPISTTISSANHQINTRLTRNNQHLITMLLFQVSLTVIFYMPYIVIYLYGIYNSTPSNSLLLLVYTIFKYIARWFWFTNFCKSFYINILSSRTFLNILKRRIIRLLLPSNTDNQQNRPHRSNPNVVPWQSTSSSNYDYEFTRTQNPAVISN